MAKSSKQVNRKISEGQNGLRPDRLCIDNNTATEKRFERDDKMQLVFIDLEKVYVPRKNFGNKIE